MPQSFFPLRPAAAPAELVLDIDICGTNSIVGAYRRQITSKGLQPSKVVLNIRRVLHHVDLPAEIANAREEFGLSEGAMVLGSVLQRD